MAIQNRSNHRRQPDQRAEDFQLAWKTQAPDATFGGKSLADLEAAIAAEREAGTRMQALRIERAGASTAHAQLQDQLRDLLRTVVNGVKGDPAFGENCPLYKSMGYVVLSERASGLTRRGSPPGDANTAA